MAEKPLAEAAWAEEWDVVSQRVLAGRLHDLHEPYMGMTVLHIASYHGSVDIVAMLVERTNIDPNALDLQTGFTPLHWAVFNGSIACVERLLRAGVSIDIRTKEQHPPTRPSKADTFLHRLSHGGRDSAPTPRRSQGGVVGSPYVEHCDVPKSPHAQHAPTPSHPPSLAPGTAAGMTALMLAVDGGHLSIVEAFLKHSADLDVQDDLGRTALMHAALAGHPSIVDMLLGQFADIDVLDNDGHSVLVLLHVAMKQQQQTAQGPSTVGSVNGTSSSKGLLKERWHRCIVIIQREVSYREISAVYRAKLRAQVLRQLENGFDDRVFKLAVQCDPSLGRAMLNDCLVPSRHSLGFHELDKVYGLDSSIQSSALYTVLHHATDDVDGTTLTTKRLCLDHVVMRRILRIKWELFGKRLYIQQLLMYLLLLTCVTVSATISSKHVQDPRATNTIFLFSILNFAVVVVFLIVGWVATLALHPNVLWRLARYSLDGKWTPFDPAVPVTAAVRSRAQWGVLLAGVVVSSLACAPVVWTVYTSVTNAWYPTFNIVNIILIACTALFFLLLECKELMGAYAAGFNPTKGRHNLKLASMRTPVHVIKFVVLVVLLVVYVPWELGAYAVQDTTVQYTVHICLGTFLSLALWALSLQYLQVHPTAGYLLPMLSGLVVDVWNLILLYGVLQWGLACAYMNILKQPLDEPGYETWFRSFTFAYLILVGQVQLEDEFDSSNAILYGYGRFLVMVQVAVATIVLLNMLVAMMNKRVLDGLAVAKVEALASYAHFILRLELGLSVATQRSIKYLTDASGHQFLHPAFYEPWMKNAAFASPDDVAVVDDLKANRERWMSTLETLQAAVVAEYARWFDQFPQEEATLGASEQAVVTQFDLAMTKPHVNLLRADDTLRQLAAWVDLHVSSLPLDPAHFASLRTFVLPQFDQMGKDLVGKARSRLESSASTPLATDESRPTPPLASSPSWEHGQVQRSQQVEESEARLRMQIDASHHALLQEMLRQNAALHQQLRDMEARLALRPHHGA